MHSIGVFNHVTLDGCYAGPHGEIDWFKSIQKDAEFERYTQEQSTGGSKLLMGRTTYQMMKSYWPTEQARKSDPHMAEVMNDSEKIVFSKTLDPAAEAASWKNVTVLRAVERDAVVELKRKSDLTILGSGTIVQQLANLGLIDAYQLVVVPLILGEGKRLFESVRTTDLTLRDAKHFGNGVVVLNYVP
jgi:dihydrofolate reductase